MDIENLENALNRIGKHPEANCWGLTAFVLGWRSRLYYMKAEIMDRRLDTRLRHLERKPKRFRLGDVAAKFTARGVSRQSNRLEHTAVYVGGGWWIHQLGYQGVVKLHKFDTMIREYGGQSRFYRAR